MAERDEQRSPTDENSEIKVTDRRQFTAEGRLRDDAVHDEPADEEPEPQTATADTEESPAVEGSAFEHRPVEEPEGVDFTMLLNAMAEPAILFLGEIPHPATGEPTVDLERAKIQIDMLDLLRVKCRGNLSAEEDGLLDRILYQLRMLYVAKANQPPKS